MLANKIHKVDVLDGLKMLPSNSIHCVVTSPPYWGLRDYGVLGQLGLESTPEEYIAKMVLVFREIRRVLRNDGTLWLNIGDTYYGGKGANGASRTGMDGHEPINVDALISTQPGEFRPQDRPHPELKAKDLVGIPWELALALRKDGWYLRQDIIWSKPNPMPESIHDRCTKSHEYIFLLTKSRKYYYDQVSIMQPVKLSSQIRLQQDVANQTGSHRVPGKVNGTMKARSSGNKARVPAILRGVPSGNNKNQAANVPWTGELANKKSVWVIPTMPYKDAHFATFPVKLIEDCIKAGTPAGGIVFDPFMGSGTTAIVASSLGRNFLGFELNPKYIKIAEKRINKELGLFLPQPFEILQAA